MAHSINSLSIIKVVLIPETHKVTLALDLSFPVDLKLFKHWKSLLG